MECSSKYDIMNKKAYKYSEILSSFISKYVLSFTKKKKCETIKILLDKILLDAHILFEIKKDVINYLRTNNNDINALGFLKEIELSSKELEKVLLVYLLVDVKNYDIVYQLFVDLISNKLTESELVSYICKGLSEEDQNILKFAMSEDYDFNLLPANYKRLVLEDHADFMDVNINIYTNKYENQKTKILKGIKLYKEKVDMNISSEIKKYKSVKQKIKD